MTPRGLLGSASMLDMEVGSKQARSAARSVIQQAAARSLICSLAISALYDGDGPVPEEADMVMPTIAGVLADVYNDTITAQDVADF